MNAPSAKRVLVVTATVALVAALALPTAISSLTGSGNVTDVVQLSVTTGSLPALASSATGSSASGAPVTSGASAFTLDNLGSNVDTFVRYDWGLAPYYGGDAAKSSIGIRGATHRISDLLWFRQSSIVEAGTTSSDYYSPLVLKATDVSRATFAATGNACTGWSGTAADGFAATAAGTLTYKYYGAESQTDDSPLASEEFHYCLDVANSLVYLGKTASFTAATLVSSAGADSANGALKTYQYEFLSSAQTKGNKYCLTGVTGAGTAATPNLVQCQKLPYELAGSTTAKLFVLFDPPAYFPSVNQGGALTYSIAGTQWNPYASATTNAA